MKQKTARIVLASVTAAALVGVGTWWLTKPSPAPRLTVPAPACLPDPSAAIAAGGVFDGHGACYNLPNGLQISQPVVVENATLNDTATGPTKVPGQQLSWHPVIRVKSASRVALINLTLTGFQHTGGIHPKNGVAQAGIKIDGSSNVWVLNVHIEQVAGDGLTLAYEPGEAENTGIAVNGLSIDNVGRVGVTVSYVSNAVLANVTLGSVKTAGVDFESDGATIGSSNVTFDNLAGVDGVLMQQNLQGPVAFNNSNFSGDVGIVRGAAGSGQPVTFNGGTILMKRSFHGVPPAGIWISGPANVVFTGVTLGRQPGRAAPTGPAWSVTGGGSLTLNHSPFVAPAGSNDAASSVTIIP